MGRGLESRRCAADTLGADPTMSHHEWAVRCKCGAVLEQPDEYAASKAFAYWGRHGNDEHGTPVMLQRSVTFGEWEESRVLASA